MRAKKLIKKLEDLATSLTLAQKDAGKYKDMAMRHERYSDFDYWRGREEAHKRAFNEVDGIIKEARK